MNTPVANTLTHGLSYFHESIEYTPAASHDEQVAAWVSIYNRQRGYDRESAEVMAQMRCGDGDELFVDDTHTGAH